MKPSKFIAVKAACIGMGALLSSVSHAYVIETCNGNPDKKFHWRDADIPGHPSPPAIAKFKLSKVFGENSTAALEVAKDRWNSTPAAIYFEIEEGDTSVGKLNGQSEIWWSSSLTSKPAETFVKAACVPGATGAIQEVDIVFNTNYQSEFYRGESKAEFIPYGGDRISFISTAMREMGRAIGLKYVNGYYSLMNNSAANAHFQTNGSYARAYVGEDTIDGALDIYGSKYMWTSRNVGATHWKYDPESETHKKTAMYNQFQEKLQSQKINGEDHFKVVRGQTYAAEFTFENLTYYTSTVDIGIYISSNDNITRNDRLLRTYDNLELVMNKPNTMKITVTIPNDLAGDKAYYLGAIANYNYELVQNNNSDDDAAYLPMITD